MSAPDPRRPYRRFAAFFLITGGAFLLVGLARISVAPDLLQGNPIPAALVLLAVGAGLAWTVRQWPAEEPPQEAPMEDDGADSSGGVGERSL